MFRTIDEGTVAQNLSLIVLYWNHFTDNENNIHCRKYQSYYLNHLIIYYQISYFIKKYVIVLNRN